MKKTINAALGFLGDYSSIILALFLVIGFSLPELAKFCKPLLTPIIFIMMALSFMRTKPSVLFSHFKRPQLLLSSVLWMLVAMPLILYFVALATNLAQFNLDLLILLVIIFTAPPIMTAPAFTYLLNLDGSLSLSVIALALIMVPITAPVFVSLLLPATLAIDPYLLSAKLAIILIGSAIVGFGLRQIIGPTKIERMPRQLNGLNTLMMFVFAAASMDGVASFTFSHPLQTIVITISVFVIAFVQLGLTYILFKGNDKTDGFIIAFTLSGRNIALMIAAMGGHVPHLVWMFFGLAQIQIFLFPMLLKKAAQNLAITNGKPTNI
ncbi:hypothetical protein [Polycladidibacter stylochi]|uniref:hypothetical protein n=1 Tax=Polycladidibacter stylochi TaxID=1807766 RepID=UPI0008318A39|nr:hypothetical protein [Pseudovibrio stylochi]